MVSDESENPQAAERPGRGDSDAVVVWHGDRDAETGDPIEPEEQRAEIVQPVRTLVTIGTGHMREDVPLAALPGEIQKLAAQQQGHIAHQMTAGELAASIIQRCGNCLQFDRERWLRTVKRIESSGDKGKMEDLNRIRGELARSLDVNLSSAHDDGSGGSDLEHALRALGLCVALSDRDNDIVLTFAESACQWPEAFRARRELSSKRAAASGYDWVMRAAQKGQRG